MMNPMSSRPSQAAPKGQGVEQQLIQLLTEAAKVAADNGIDFRAILMQFMKGDMAGSPPAPPPA